MLRNRTVTVHVLYECGACGGAMLSTATGVGVGTITVTMKCPVCEETNMALSAILSDEDAAAWWANAYEEGEI